ncbi:PLDc N-terminal domain-containing protein [Nonomuraea aurantiaca]|uniref:PLDc N-terminal domain-containing protein n=1 Tax=Nonomuraea aurantiaca TaxID=2878562 RepID=UPI001CD9E741|nr:PLDc N-terminal domain-containing protein [Nonomuraea aurantiaca]MCA2229939.1 hypothetical protein [Nonomuraea aurantiaca]
MRWNELSERQRGLLLVAVSAEFALTATAAVDLWFRPRDEVRGRKELWWLGIFVQPIGRIAYLMCGRRSRCGR